jgi:hypothetical protein
VPEDTDLAANRLMPLGSSPSSFTELSPVPNATRSRPLEKSLKDAIALTVTAP